MEHDLCGNVRIDFWIVCRENSELLVDNQGNGEWRTTEADVIRSRTAIKNLKRDLAGKLIGPRKSDNRKNTFNVLAMDSRTQGYARAKHEYIYAQTAVAKGIFHVEDEVARGKVSND